jgi:manganese-dependent inorganic pyrophosphatase
MPPDSSTIYVLGHRNPDTDAICSAIGYAAFLRATRECDAQAACCGELTVRTAWVLQQAGLPAPKLIMDVRPTALTICRREVLTASPDETFLAVYRRMIEHHFRAMPVVDAEGRLLGIPTIQELAELFLPPDDTRANSAANRAVFTSLKNVSAALGAPILGDSSDQETFEELLLVVAASSKDTTKNRAQQFPARRVAIVTGDRPEIHALAVELKVRCLIITGGFMPSEELQAQAREHGVAILVSVHDTASTSQLIRFSRAIGEAMVGEFVSFTARTLLSEVKHEVQQSHQPLFPVVDEETRTLLGVFSKSDLVNVPRTKLVLVDHNEFAQAVTGADDADIVEVIDHHRLSGNLRTKEPVRFINEPVGSTSTIVALMFRMRGLAPDQPTALCLCAGMVSDTLNLTSPTTTNTDREILPWLAGIAGIQAEAFVRDFFAAGSMLRENSPAAAVESDRKEFEENGWRISISQIEELGLDEFWKREQDLQAALDTVCKAKQVHFACLMVTDITEHYSVLLVAGNERVIDAIEYPRLHKHLFEMRGVVSRKKQLFPHLGRLLGKLAAP